MGIKQFSDWMVMKLEHFKISLDEYKISGGMLSTNCGGSGLIQVVILTDAQGNAIKLDENNFFGIEISR